MGFPQSYAGAVENIYNGQHVQPAVPVPMPLGVNVPCRRVLLVASAANQSVVYLVSQKEQGQNAAACAAVGSAG